MNEPPRLDRLRCGTFLAPNILPVYEAVAEEVARRLGVETELFVETDYAACAADENEVCFICSLPCVQLEREGAAPYVPVAAPVLIGERYGGRPVYFSDVIVHVDSPFHSFLDLRGHSWACNEPLSQSGYGITRYHLLELGETHGFFSEVIETGFHETSMRLVANGEVAGSAIDSQVLAVALRDDPVLARSLRVVDALGPSTIQPVAVSRRVPERQRLEIREVLTAMHEDPVMRERLAQGMVERFVPADASSYDDVRRMLEACEAAGFMQLR